MITTLARRRWWIPAVCALSLGCGGAYASQIVASEDDDLNVTATVVEGSWYADRGKIKVKVTDKDGHGVANKWVNVVTQGGENWCIGPTNADGTDVENVKSSGAIPNIKTASIQDPRAGGKDPHGSLFFNATFSTLSYTGGTMQEVWYDDGSHVFSNGPQESILGADVLLDGMKFLGYDAFGEPRFSDGTMTISSALGTFLSAQYTDVRLWTDPLTGDNVLWGQPDDFHLNTGLGSRFIDDFGSDLASFPQPSFYLDSASNLAAATENFSISGGISVDSCPLGGSAKTPEPATLSMVGAALIALGVIPRRVARQLDGQTVPQ